MFAATGCMSAKEKMRMKEKITGMGRSDYRMAAEWECNCYEMRGEESKRMIACKFRARKERLHLFSLTHDNLNA